MSAELVERLRNYPCEYCGTDCIEAADLLEAQAAEIVRMSDVNAGMKIDIRGLRDCIKTQAAEIERLRKVLADIAEYGDDPEHPAVLNIADKARDALENKP